ncbi:MAG TPA: hypothetical protein VKR06_03090 [Ktedonosporobacter sp.]|nr:hypothetical protein [Ktedonosporobacter sp.]
MQCRSCGIELTVGSAYCHRCGAATLSTGPGTSPSSPTVVSPPPNTAQPKPLTNYEDETPFIPSPSSVGQPTPSTPFEVLSYNPYGSSNPYATPVPPPPPRRFSVQQIVLVAAALLLLVVGSGGMYYAFVLKPQAQARIEAATATAFANTPEGIYSSVTRGTPVFASPLSQNDQQQNWTESVSDRGGCAFTAGAYHISSQMPNTSVGCFAERTNFGDFAYQVEMTIVKGDAGSLAFRASVAKGYYVVFFSSDGMYNFIYFPAPPATASVLRSGTATGFKRGLNQTNVLTVVARGNTFYLYANKQFILTQSDSSTSTGFIGLGATDVSQPTETIFKNLQIWNA